MSRISDVMKKLRYDYLMLVSPAAIIMVIFFVYPIMIATYFSLLDYSILRGTKMFIGLQNYFRLFSQDIFLKSVFNTLVWVSICTVMPLLMGLLAGLLTYTRLRGYKFFRAIFSIPIIFIPSATAIIWALMYSDPFGLINHVLEFLGLERRIWLGDPVTALPAIAVADAWFRTPMTYLMLLAGLESLPQQPIEASEVDGASGFQRVRYVILPMLWPIFAIVALLRLIDSVRVFALIWIMTQGGPGISSVTLPVAVFKTSFLYYDYGAGCAWGVITVLICLALSIFLIWRRREVW